MRSRVRALLLATSAIGISIITVSAANAGAFALREQSAYGQGSSFAGIAAGGALSSMYWNGATMTQFAGMNSEFSVSAIFPDVTHTTTTSAFLGAFPVPSQTGSNAAVPSSYFSYQVNDRIWVGMAVNAPFGLSVKFPMNSTATAYAQDASVGSINLNPNIAFKVNEMISVSLGIQAQYLRTRYFNFGGAVGNDLVLQGDGWNYGWTAGLTVTPWAGTSIGIGYRSHIDQDISGTLSGGIGAITRGPVNLTLPLPDTVTVGLRHRLNERWTFLAGYEWANWSRIGTPLVFLASGAPAFGPAGAGGGQFALPFQYSDGHFFSVGAEYMWAPDLMLRAGIAFEQSPITDRVRTPRLPDNDRIWYSVGATFAPALVPKVKIDLGYSYIDVKNTPIDVSAASGNPFFVPAAGPYTGSVNTHISIFSIALRYRWDDPAPVRRTALITK